MKFWILKSVSTFHINISFKPSQHRESNPTMAKDNLTNLLSQLDVQSSKDEHSKVQETCLNLLNNGCSKPIDILRQLLAAVIKQDNYQKGLSFLHKFRHIDEKHETKLALEKLYIFYKLNMKTHFESLFTKVFPKVENLESLQNIEKEGIRGLLHVRAQFCYKNGYYEEAFKIYQFLAKHNNTNLDNELELSCNERVPLSASPDLLLKNSLVTKINDDSYDLLFNESFILSSTGKFVEAVDLLRRTLAMAKEEGNQSDIDTIELQLAYVHQLNENKSESKTILTSIIERLESSSPLRLIANMNLKSFTDFSKYANNINLVLRELNVEKLNSLNLQNLTHKQWSTIQNNLLFLHLFNNNSIQSKETLISRTLSTYQNIVSDVVLETYKTQAKKLYHSALTSVSSGTDGSVIGHLLLAIQLQIVEKNWDNAVRLGETFLNKAWKSNTIKEQDYLICYILFELYNITGRNHSKIILLIKLQKIRKAAPVDITENLSFWKHVGFQLLSLNKIEDANKLFKKIMKTDLYASDNEYNELINSIISKEAFEMEKGSSLVEDIDIEQLISAGVTPLESTTKVSKTSKNNRVYKKHLKLKQKKKSAKVAKYLQSHDQSKLPDPERWIPLKDRSTYKPKKKQQLAKETQGGAMNKKAEQALDISRTSAKKTMSNKKNKKKGRK